MFLSAPSALQSTTRLSFFCLGLLYVCVRTLNDCRFICIRKELDSSSVRIHWRDERPPFLFWRTYTEIYIPTTLRLWTRGAGIRFRLFVPSPLCFPIPLVSFLLLLLLYYFLRVILLLVEGVVLRFSSARPRWTGLTKTNHVWLADSRKNRETWSRTSSSSSSSPFFSRRRDARFFSDSISLSTRWARQQGSLVWKLLGVAPSDWLASSNSSSSAIAAAAARGSIIVLPGSEKKKTKEEGRKDAFI